MISIEINDCFDEIVNENQRLFNELIFAKKCHKLLCHLKDFLDTNEGSVIVEEYIPLKTIYTQLQDICSHVIDTTTDQKIPIDRNRDIEHKPHHRLSPEEDNERPQKTTKKNTKRKCDKSLKINRLPKQEISDPEVSDEDTSDTKSIEYQIRDSILEEFRKGVTHLKTKRNICNIYGEELGQEMCRKWFREFRSQGIKPLKTVKTKDTDNECIYRDGVRVYQCRWPECGKEFRQRCLVRDHEMIHSDTRPYVCKWPGCEYRANRRHALNKHELIHTRIREPPIRLPLRHKPKDSTDSGGKDTSDASLDKLAVRKFLLQEFQKGVAVCEAYKTMRGLYGNVLNNKTCHKWYQRFRSGNLSVDDFARKGRPKKFKVTYKEGKPVYHCEWPDCGAQYYSQNNLRHHTLRHQNIMTHRCDWPGCEYGTVKKRMLDYHKSIHTGIRMFKCKLPDCERTFSRPDHLSGHMLWHNNDKKFRCEWPGCQYRSCFRGNVAKHKKQKHGFTN